MQKLLSICIPTYNRLVFLQKSLSKLLPQYRDEIEIIVSDNSENDDTYNYINSIKKNYPFIKYFKNEKNIGADGNFLSCLNRASGKYVLLLADDDMVCENFTDEVVSFIWNQQINYAFINVNVRCCKANEELGPYIIKTEKNLTYNENNISDYFKLMHVYLTFSSMIIFSKEEFSKIIDPKRFLNTNLLQTHIIFEMLKFNKNVAIIAKTYVISLLDNSGGYNIYKVFIKNWHDALFVTAKSSKIPVKTLKYVFNLTLKHYLPYWVIKMRSGNANTFNLKPKWRYAIIAWRYSGAWLRFYPSMILPLKLINYIKKKLKKPNALEKG